MLKRLRTGETSRTEENEIEFFGCHDGYPFSASQNKRDTHSIELIPPLHFLQMLYRTLADFVIVIHFVFIAFAVAGAALLLVRRVPRWIAFVHLACAVWASYVMFSGRICPLTPLENYLRRVGGESGYSQSFIERYLFSVIYPDGLTRELQIALGAGVILLNAFIYCFVVFRWPRGK
jgi:hypothetical protein